MKYALFNGNKVEAIKGSIGVCSYCGSKVIAKCGDQKIHHWAHKGIRTCDPWWENETSWHRSWKNNYPENWQEIPLMDEATKEKHIADVRTPDGLVIEFQHSSIKPNERIAREKFYKNMVWIINGTRLVRDYPRFVKEKVNFIPTPHQGLFHVDFLEECFPSAWVGSSVPVIFDFKGNDTIDDPKDIRNYLYCILPKKDGRYTFLAALIRRGFIDGTISGEFIPQLMRPFAKPNQDQIVQPQKDLQKPKVKKVSQYILVNGRFIKPRRF